MLLSSIALIELEGVDLEHGVKVTNKNGSQLCCNVKVSRKQESIYPGVGHRTGI